MPDRTPGRENGERSARAQPIVEIVQQFATLGSWDENRAKRDVKVFNEVAPIRRLFIKPGAIPIFACDGDVEFNEICCLMQNDCAKRDIRPAAIRRNGPLIDRWHDRGDPVAELEFVSELHSVRESVESQAFPPSWHPLDAGM